MPLFGWFSRKSTLQREADRVFMTRDAKWRALRETAAEMRDRGECVVVVAHFPATLTEVAERLAAADVSTSIEDRVVRPTELAMRLSENRDGPIPLLPAPVLSLEDDEVTPVQSLPGVTVLVPEMYPLPAREAEVEAFAEQLPLARLSYFASLEDPVMKLFVGAGVETILRQLGMKDDEEIHSQMVSRQIRRAQQRIARSVETEVSARSVEEWMERNMPGGG